MPEERCGEERECSAERVRVSVRVTCGTTMLVAGSGAGVETASMVGGPGKKSEMEQAGGG